MSFGYKKESLITRDVSFNAGSFRRLIEGSAAVRAEVKIIGDAEGRAAGRIEVLVESPATVKTTTAEYHE
jgi:hypothetical protein